MSYAPYTNLQATPDFATFQFSSPTPPEPIIRQVRFIGQQGGRIYQVEFRNKPAGKKDDPPCRDMDDLFCVELTILQIIEIYSERYPRRILRCDINTMPNALVFTTIMTRYRHLLNPLFVIEQEVMPPSAVVGNERPGGPGGNERSYAWIIKRKPIPFFSIHTIESTWNGSSRIFKRDFSIELEKSIRVGLTMPTI